jgi:hypothetical protein
MSQVMDEGERLCPSTKTEIWEVVCTCCFISVISGHFPRAGRPHFTRRCLLIQPNFVRGNERKNSCAYLERTNLQLLQDVFALKHISQYFK